jgi:hypothetical protein
MSLSKDDREIVGKMFGYIKERENECKRLMGVKNVHGAVEQLFLAETHTRSLLLLLLRSVDRKAAEEITAEYDL